jgi:TetR/AcrR family transcriptional regulator of autoinduction and epiphytic fitness
MLELCCAMPVSAATVPAIDGRNARALRTREAVAEALLDLVQRGVLRPTATQVAARAGVSERAVFRHFDDLESLFATVAKQQIERVAPRLSAAPAEGPLAQRIDALVTRRADLYEQLTPVRRASLLQEPFSKVVAGRLTWSRDTLRTEVARVFAPEIARLPTAARREVLDALGAAASWSVWENLRRHARLSRPRAQRAVARMIAALLADAERPRTSNRPKRSRPRSN